MSYYDSYCSACSRYRNACSEISSCTNRINSYTSERSQEKERLNALKLELKRHKTVLSQLNAMIAKEGSLDSDFTNVKNKVATASANYIKSVIESDVTAKDLTVVYEQETASTKRMLTDTFSSLRSAKSTVEDKIADLERQISECQGRIDSLTGSISRETSSRESWKRARNNASWDADYYWNLYQQELWEEEQERLREAAAANAAAAAAGK